jgi:hypothetical protein
MHGLSARGAIESRFLERALCPRGTGAGARKKPIRFAGHGAGSREDAWYTLRPCR